MRRVRNGFTLIELLIVIVVIGVLAAMLMLSSTEAVSSAKAANIISNMTQFKKAAIAWYVDNLDKIVPYSDKYGSGYGVLGANGQAQSMNDYFKNNTKEILAYISNRSSITLKSKRDSSTLKAGDYIIKDVNLYKQWYICYYVGTDKRLQEKLASRTKSLSLLGLDDIGHDISEQNKAKEYKNHKIICLQILSLAD